VIFPAEDILPLGIGAAFGLILQPRIGIEGVLLALALLLRGELLAFRFETRLRGEMCGIGPGGCVRSALAASAARGARGLQSRGKAFEVALLFG